MNHQGNDLVEDVDDVVLWFDWESNDDISIASDRRELIQVFPSMSRLHNISVDRAPKVCLYDRWMISSACKKGIGEIKVSDDNDGELVIPDSSGKVRAMWIIIVIVAAARAIYFRRCRCNARDGTKVDDMITQVMWGLNNGLYSLPYAYALLHLHRYKTKQCVSNHCHHASSLHCCCGQIMHSHMRSTTRHLLEFETMANNGIIKVGRTMQSQAVNDSYRQRISWIFHLSVSSLPPNQGRMNLLSNQIMIWLVSLLVSAAVAVWMLLATNHALLLSTLLHLHPSWPF